LAATLDFTSFFTMAFLGAAHFFYSWAVFGLDIHTLESKGSGFHNISTAAGIMWSALVYQLALHVLNLAPRQLD